MADPVKTYNEETGSVTIQYELQRNDVEKVLRATDEAITKFLTECGMHLEREAKYELENDPRRIDTGLLRNSITFALGGEETAIKSYSADRPRKQWVPGEDGEPGHYERAGEIPTGTYSGHLPADTEKTRTLYVGTNVEYSVYVHEGTKKMTPNRYLKNAFEKNMQQIEQKAIEAFSQISGN